MSEPSDEIIRKAAWKWAADKSGRYADADDVRYFIVNWRYLPGLRAYVDSEMEAANG
jgi:hypothetical protein